MSGRRSSRARTPKSVALPPSQMRGAHCHWQQPAATRMKRRAPRKIVHTLGRYTATGRHASRRAQPRARGILEPAHNAAAQASRR